MRISRIDAIRYGGLENACLSPLGEGLTVVLGPNESGKTTFTALTRHVLYGFPDARTKEPGYQPSAGPREAQLTVGDATGEWVIKRTDGARGGALSVTPLAGPERPDLVAEMVSGVTPSAFHIVFGFGLDELSKIEGGSQEEIINRLHAANTGLAVDPFVVRRDLADEAAKLYSPRAQKPELNALAAAIKDSKAQIRALENEAASFGQQQQRLAELAAQIEPLRARRDELAAALRATERDLTKVEEKTTELQSVRAKLEELAHRVAAAQRDVEVVTVDERVLAAEPALVSALEGQSLFEQRLERITAAEAAAAETREAIAALGAIPAQAKDDPGVRAELEAARDLRTKLSLEAEQATRAAETAAQRLASASAQLEASNQQAASSAEPGRRPAAPTLAAGVAAVVGLVLGAAGVVLGQLLLALLGGLIAAAGVIALALTLRTKPAEHPADPLEAEIPRLRAEADSTARIAAAASERAAHQQRQWEQWLEARSLGVFGPQPAAVAQLLETLRQRDELVRQAAMRDAEAAREREAAQAWVITLVDAVRSYDASAGDVPALHAATGLAARAKLDLDRTRRAAQERTELARALESARLEAERTSARAQALADEIAQIATAYGVPAADALSELSASRDALAAQAAEIAESYEALARERDVLEGALGAEGRDNRMSLLRQELEGARAQSTALAQRYATLQLAVTLIDRARERFERERQPELVRTAARVFSAMTDGRYTDVRVPLDGSSITVTPASGAAPRTSAHLSRGTAEQLYLALRVGLIESLGDLGRSLPVLMDDVVVNFDPQRRAGAVAAVAELAKARQVIFFTCHPETAELLAAGVPGASVVSLDRCELRA